MRLHRALTFVMASLILVGSAKGTDRNILRWIQKAPKIKEISIEGNTYFTDNDIRERLYAKTSNVWREFVRDDRRVRLQRETSDRDSLEVMFLYLSNGFLGATFSERVEAIGPDSSAHIIITVREGKQFLFGEKHITGEYDGHYAWGMTKIGSKLKTGHPMNLFQIRDASFEMKSLLANEGYPYAQVSYRIDTATADSLSDMTFNIIGDSLVHFGQVTIKRQAIDRDTTKQTDTLPDYVVRRELKLKPGAIYRRDDILLSQQRLYESGYFSTLALTMDDKSPDRLRPNFLLTIRERKPRYLTFQTGAAQSQTRDLTWDFSTGFGKRNFMHSRRIDMSSYYSFAIGTGGGLIEHKYTMSYTEPWFLNFRAPMTLAGQIEPKRKSDKQDYDISKWAVSISVLKKWSRELQTSIGFEYQSVNISNIDPALLPSVKQEEGNSIKRRFYWDFRRDSRNDLFIPERGSLTSIDAQYVGGFLGGDDNFKKIEASYSSYQRVWPGWISATRFMGGWVAPFNTSSFVPTDDRLYLGGANSIRGFKEKSLGPVLPDGSPAGANFTIVFNQEFRWRTFPLFKFISKRFASRFPLWQSLFVDAGNGFGSASRFRWDEIALSYGTGIQIVSPAGPIRVDYAQVVPTNGFRFQQRWHFTILYAF
jgi:outer membrane protein insertion porin family